MFEVVLWDSDIIAMYSLTKCKQLNLIEHLLVQLFNQLNWDKQDGQ